LPATGNKTTAPDRSVPSIGWLQRLPVIAQIGSARGGCAAPAGDRLL